MFFFFSIFFSFLFLESHFSLSIQYDMDFNILGTNASTSSTSSQTLSPSFVTTTGTLWMQFAVQITPYDLPSNYGFSVALYGENGNPTFPPTYRGTGYYENTFASLGNTWKCRHLMGVDDNAGLLAPSISPVTSGVSPYGLGGIGYFWLQFNTFPTYNQIQTGVTNAAGTSPTTVQSCTWTAYGANTYYFGFGSENTMKHVYNLTWSTNNGSSWVTNTESRLNANGTYSIKTSLLGFYRLTFGQTIPSTSFLLKFNAICTDTMYIGLFSGTTTTGYQIALQAGNVILSHSIPTSNSCPVGPCWSTNDQIAVSHQDCTGYYYPYWIAFSNGVLAYGTGKLHYSPSSIIAQAMWNNYQYPISSFGFSNNISPVSFQQIRYSLDTGITYSVITNSVTEN